MHYSDFTIVGAESQEDLPKCRARRGAGGCLNYGAKQEVIMKSIEELSRGIRRCRRCERCRSRTVAVPGVRADVKSTVHRL